MNEPIITLIGNLAADPELRFTPSGVAVCKLRMAQTPRDKKGDTWEDGEPFWQDVTVWREMAENVAESLRRGDRVIVTGRLKQREYEAKDGGGKRRATDLEADAIGPDLRYAEAKPVKKAKASGGGASTAKGSEDSWAGASAERPQAAQPSADTQRASQSSASPW
jgi:single-strand DNA-binding protein